MTILEGEQGTGKSHALKVLGGQWITDQIGDLGSREAAEQLQGVWLVELSELESMTRPEVGRVKAFVSRSTDRFREAYGRRVGTFPRQTVFFGTVPSGGVLTQSVPIGDLPAGTAVRAFVQPAAFHPGAFALGNVRTMLLLDSVF